MLETSRCHQCRSVKYDGANCTPFPTGDQAALKGVETTRMAMTTTRMMATTDHASPEHHGPKYSQIVLSGVFQPDTRSSPDFRLRGGSLSARTTTTITKTHLGRSAFFHTNQERNDQFFSLVDTTPSKTTAHASSHLVLHPGWVPPASDGFVLIPRQDAPHRPLVPATGGHNSVKENVNVASGAIHTGREQFL